jgi:hypothetical protein
MSKKKEAKRNNFIPEMPQKEPKRFTGPVQFSMQLSLVLSTTRWYRKQNVYSHLPARDPIIEIINILNMGS